MIQEAAAYVDRSDMASMSYVSLSSDVSSRIQEDIIHTAPS